ncbi:MAG: hypothetical protein ACOYO1_07015 [Bacteroidales bacterium]
MYKVLLFFALLILYSLSYSQTENVENKVIKIAENNLSVSLSKIPIGMEKYYGFSDRKEFIDASIGKPYRVISLSNEFYSNQKLSTTNYIQIKNEWRVPVIVKGANKILLTVIRQDTSFEVVDLGGAALAEELQQKSKYSFNDELYILRIYPLAIDFFVRISVGSSFSEALYIPLNSAINGLSSLKEKNLTKLNLTDVFSITKQKLSKPYKD